MEPSSHESGVNSLLALAVRQGRCDALDVLLSANADPESRDEEGNTFLLLAAKRGNRDVILALLKHGADINSQDGQGKNIFDKLFMHGHFSLAQEMWEASEPLGFVHEHGDAM
eukprot:768531-Hanusia_phi.AAC.9